MIKNCAAGNLNSIKPDQSILIRLAVLLAALTLLGTFTSTTLLQHFTSTFYLNNATKVTGAHNRSRTGDLFLTKEVLYLLSYVGSDQSVNTINLISVNHQTDTPQMERVMGIEPTSSAWKAEVLPLNYTRTTPALHRHYARMREAE
jgi:hypothetical protein